MSSSGASRGGSGAAFTQGTAAARPAATPNALYFATDTGELTIANAAGNAWQSLQGVAGDFKVGVPAANASLLSGNGGAIGFSGGNIAFNRTAIVSANVEVFAAGSGLQVKEGANCKQGISAAMVAGTVTIANTSVTANSRIFLTRAPGGTNPGACNVSAIVAGTSFTITSTNAADTGTVFWEIFEPGV